MNIGGVHTLKKHRAVSYEKHAEARLDLSL